MINFLPTLNLLLPLLAFLSLLLGIRYQKIYYLIGALWISLIALMTHYQTAGGEILGTYFDYKRAAIYSFNLLIVLFTLLYLFFKLPGIESKYTRIIAKIFIALLIIGEALLLINLWTNAYFVETRAPNTRILQVATFRDLPYCK